MLLILVYISDLIFGDPRWMPHPVRGLGKLIAFLDDKLRRKTGRDGQRMRGVVIVLIAAGISTLSTFLVLLVSNKLSPLLGKLVWVYVGYSTLCVKDLLIHARAIQKELEGGFLEKARYKLSYIVARDTKKLSKEQIIKGALESIAESTNDGVIAPLFYLILGGPVWAVLYKTINTLDSMIGYKNEKYIDFGWFSAKLDDVFNFIPARITGFLISVSSFVFKRNFIGAFTVMLRDGNKHLSPNSGISEAAMAGALGVRLGGPCAYESRIIEKAYFGEDNRPVQSSLIKEALLLSLLASFFMVLLGVLLK